MNREHRENSGGGDGQREECRDVEESQLCRNEESGPAREKGNFRDVERGVVAPRIVEKGVKGAVSPEVAADGEGEDEKACADAEPELSRRLSNGRLAEIEQRGDDGEGGEIENAGLFAQCARSEGTADQESGNETAGAVRAGEEPEAE
jgi:hypothetical protein